MKIEEKYINEINSYAREREKIREVVNNKLDENFLSGWHKMLVEEKECLDKVYQDLSDLEKVDLIDYQCLERNGRTNKKR